LKVSIYIWENKGGFLRGEAFVEGVGFLEAAFLDHG